jgi:hypothetical protein
LPHLFPAARARRQASRHAQGELVGGATPCP